jgi:hypothetical protein
MPAPTKNRQSTKFPGLSVTISHESTGVTLAFRLLSRHLATLFVTPDTVAYTRTAHMPQPVADWVHDFAAALSGKLQVTA